jgi:hypothetical protein
MMVKGESEKGIVVTTAISPPRARRKRLSLLAALSLLVSIPIVLVEQTPAFATVTVSLFAGTGTAGFSGDGGQATSAQLRQPTGVFADEVGNVYIYDDQNRRIRKVNPSGVISTHAGDGSWCSTTGLTNSFGPDNSGICSQSAKLVGGAGGVLYIPNSSSYEMVTPSGSKYHVAGTLNRPCSDAADGDAFQTCMVPIDGAIANGGLYFGSGAYFKRWNMSFTGGAISTVAGNGNSNCNSPANDGDLAVGACIHVSFPTSWGQSIYFFDSMSASGPRIFRIDLNESPLRLHKVAGTGAWSDYGTNGLAVNAGIGQAGPIAVSSTGEVYFGRTNSGDLRKVDSAGYLRYVTDLGIYSDTTSMAFDRSDNLYVASPRLHKIQKVSGLGSPGISAGKNLVALGDSVTAAEGIKYGYLWDGSKWIQTGPVNPDWADTTAAKGDDFEVCHQSEYANSQLLYAQGYTVYNMGCTGAQAIPGILNDYTLSDPDDSAADTQSAQLGGSCTECANPSAVFSGHNPDVVLLTVGADDVHFGNWIGACYDPTKPDCDTAANTEELDRQLNGWDDGGGHHNGQKDNLLLVLSELNIWAGVHGKTLRVLVTGYYDPYPASVTSSCVDTGAGILQGTWPGVGLKDGEMAWIKNGLLELNGNISTEVAYAQSNMTSLDVSYVSLANAMAGHEYCTADPWVYGPSIDYPPLGSTTPGHSPAPFHPTPAGQNKIYSLIKAALP